ncbi:MAG: hypothetical protein [Caudoviricetes sp.]|nr:MAG: hypothetical protein [Caudoviricetes sp.]
MWWMLAGAAIQGLQQMGAAKIADAQNKLQNKKIEAYNSAVASQAAKSFNQINMQKASLTAQVQEALYATEQQGLQVKSQRGLQAAATDTMGASVEQNLLDVDFKVDQAQAVLRYNGQLSDESLNAQAQNVADGAGFQLQSENKIFNQWGSGVGQAMATVGMALFENKASTGSFLGNKTSRNQGVSTSK